MSFQAVIFDLDGTLLDTLEDIAISANTVLEESNFPTHSPDNYRAFIGDGVKELLARALPPNKRSPETVDEYVNRFRQQYQRNWNVNTGLYPGVTEALDEIQSLELKLAILSNKPHDFTLKCVDELLSRWKFGCVMGHRNDIAPKPNPDGAHFIANALGVVPSTVMFVGDSENDMRAAVAAGMFPVGVLWGFRSANELRRSGARIVVSHPKELLALLDSRLTAEMTPDPYPLNPQILIDLVQKRMPFGKYKNRILCDLPEPYLVWFHQKGFPPGEIGMLLSALYEIKLNGLEYLLAPIRKNQR